MQGITDADEDRKPFAEQRTRVNRRFMSDRFGTEAAEDVMKRQSWIGFGFVYVVLKVYSEKNLTG